MEQNPMFIPKPVTHFPLESRIKPLALVAPLIDMSNDMIYLKNISMNTRKMTGLRCGCSYLGYFNWDSGLV